MMAHEAAEKAMPDLPVRRGRAGGTRARTDAAVHALADIDETDDSEPGAGQNGIYDHAGAPRDAVDQDPDEGAPDVGARLRSIRRRAGLRLKDVAAGAGCSESMLSKIETGHVSPSINMLHRIARILGTHIGTLFEVADHATPFVQRAGRRPTLAADILRRGEGIALESLTPFEIHGHLQAQIHIVEPGGASDGLISHEGEEVGYVLEGTLELVVDGQTATLSPGDSFFFASERPHGYRNPGTEVAKIVWVNAPPTY